MMFAGQVTYSQISNISSSNPHIQLSVQGNIQKDETTIYFAPAATPQFDNGYDALKPAPTNTASPSIASVNNQLDLAINALPDAPLNAIIPIRVKVPATGKYIVSADSILAMPAGSCVFLEDLQTGTMADLSLSPSGNYIIDDTSTAPRFLLHVSQPLTVSAIATSCTYKQDGKMIVYGLGSWTSVWQNAAGDTLAIHNNTLGNDTLSGLQGGLYSVHVSGSNACATGSDTITVPAAMPMTINAVINDVTCVPSSGLVDASNVSGGEAPYNYQWSNGVTTPVAQHLSAGLYALFITDAKGCTDTMSYPVQQLSHLVTGFSVDNDTLTMAHPTLNCTSTCSGQTSLAWNFGDGSLASASTAESHTYGSEGTYTITLVASDAYCSDTARRVISVLNTTSISQQELDNSVIITNSAQGSAVIFNLPVEQTAMISTYTVDGKLTSSKSLSAQKQTEMLNPGEAPGIYLVQVEINGHQIVKKITK